MFFYFNLGLTAANISGFVAKAGILSRGRMFSAEKLFLFLVNIFNCVLSLGFQWDSVDI